VRINAIKTIISILLILKYNDMKSAENISEKEIMLSEYSSKSAIEPNEIVFAREFVLSGVNKAEYDLIDSNLSESKMIKDEIIFSVSSPLTPC